MPTFEFPLANSPLTDPNNFAGKVALAGRDMMCGIYSLYPDWVLDSGLMTPMAALFDSVCHGIEGTPPLPAPPAPPFTGGQCVGVRYCVTYQMNTLNRNASWYPSKTAESCTETLEGGGLTAIYGAILGLSVELGTPYNDGTGRVPARWVLKTTNARYLVNNCTYYEKAYGYIPAGRYDYEYTLLSARRFDNAPDTCGDPPVAYPKGNPPPPSITNKTYEINKNDGTKLTVPLVFIKPTLNVKPQVNMKFNINPQFKGEINFNFDGITVNFGDSSPPTNPDSATINLINTKVDALTTNNNLVVTQTTNINNNVESIKTKSDECNNKLVEIDTDLDIIKRRIDEVDTQADTYHTTDTENQDKLDEILTKLDLQLDTVIPMSEILVPWGDYNNEGNWEETNIKLPVFAPIEKAEKHKFIEINNIKKKSGRELDACVGIPLENYETPVYECCTFYYSAYFGNDVNIGRYFNVPAPRLDLIKEWASESRHLNWSGWYKYVQFHSARGAKFMVFGESAEDCDRAYQELRPLCKYTEEEEWFESDPRQRKVRRTKTLYLKKITYYEDNSLKKAGNTPGKIIWKKH